MGFILASACSIRSPTHPLAAPFKFLRALFVIRVPLSSFLICIGSFLWTMLWSIIPRIGSLHLLKLFAISYILSDVRIVLTLSVAICI